MTSKEIFYNTNWMGPINKEWIDTNGAEWAGGRIDLYGDIDSFYGAEIGLPVMAIEDWNRFSEWLINFKSEEVLKLKELLKLYYKDGNPKIRWFNWEES